MLWVLCGEFDSIAGVVWVDDETLHYWFLHAHCDYWQFFKLLEVDTFSACGLCALIS